MLEEHRATGRISDPLNAIALLTAYKLHKEKVSSALLTEAISMSEEWVHEIITAVSLEGIQLPESKKPQNKNLIGSTLTPTTK